MRMQLGASIGNITGHLMILAMATNEDRYDPRVTLTPGNNNGDHRIERNDLSERTARSRRANHWSAFSLQRSFSATSPLPLQYDIKSVVSDAEIARAN